MLVTACCPEYAFGDALAIAVVGEHNDPHTLDRAAAIANAPPVWCPKID